MAKSGSGTDEDISTYTSLGVEVGMTVSVATCKVATSIIEANKAAKAAANFGNLQYASEHGFKPYTEMTKELKGSGLQAHHIVEQRFGLDVQTTVAVNSAEHQAFTNAWRTALPYGKTYSVDTVWEVAQEVYAQYPAILEAVRLCLGM